MPVCVTGMHRSGTSVVAHALACCGVDFGAEEELVPADQWNADGYWEDPRLVRLSDSLLAELGGAWDLPPSPSASRRRTMYARFVPAAQGALAALARREPWGWKDPRAMLLADFWSLVNEDLQFVVCVRNPLEVGLSLQRRGFTSPLLGMSLWATYYERLLETTNRSGRIVIDYDTFVSNPSGCLHSLAAKLNIDPTEQQLRDASAVVDPINRHHKAEPPHVSFLPGAVTRLYTRLLAEAANRPNPRAATTRSQLPLPLPVIRSKGGALVELSDLYQQALAVNEDRDRWRERAGSAEQEQASLNARLEAALAAAAAAEVERETSERATDEASRSAKRLEARLQAELEQLAIERDRWRTGASEYEQDRDRWQERAEGAEHERTSLNERLDAALAAAAAAETERRSRENATEELRTSAEQLGVWRTLAREREQDRDHWRERAGSAEQERASLNERLATALAAAEAAEAQRQTYEQDRDHWRERAESAEQERAMLKEARAVALAAAAAAEAQREGWEDATEELRTSAEQLEARLQTELQQLAHERDAWRRGAAEYEQDRDRWRERAGSAEQERANLNQRLEAVLTAAAAAEAPSNSARRKRAFSQFGSWLVRGRLGYVRRFFVLRRSFDRQAYLAVNRDVAAAGLDPLLHYIEHGAREGRLPGAPRTEPPDPAERPAAQTVDAVRAAEAPEAGDTNHASPQPRPAASVAGGLHWPEQLQGKLDVDASAAECEFHPPSGPVELTLTPTHLHTAADEVRRRVHAGPHFEDFDPQIALDAPPRAKAIAFYLPQFHAIPENDEWWGKGFTEWSNVARGYPRYADHYQPRLPRDLGFYDLGCAETLVRQVELARAAGIYGFSFHYYWFDGKRLLERPLERFLQDPSIEFRFCLTWANENWTRRWDGHDDDVLIAQTYDPSCDVALVDDVQRHFADSRYIRLRGRPLFLLYRVDCIPDAARRIERWRELWQARHGEEPLIFAAQAFGSVDPRLFGLDGAFEFPPHKLVEELPAINAQLTTLDPAFRGHVVAYDDVVAEALAEPALDYPLIRTAVPSWDNEARRQGAGLTLHGSTPETYECWLRALVSAAAEQPVFGEPLVLVNAWNEWAEAAYLEPDVHYGSAYLNATARALSGRRAAEKRKVLFVGHDAHRHGAQINVWHMGDTLKNQFGCDVAYLLFGDGALVAEYEQLGRVYVTNGDPARTHAALADLRQAGFGLAVTNTVVSGSIVPLLKAEGFRVVSLIHELPGIIHDLGAQECLAAILGESDTIVVPARIVADAVAHDSLVGDRLVVLPQGLYKELEEPPDARTQLRSRLGIDDSSRIVLNVGFGDLRKGIDTFVHVAKLATSRSDDLHFVWLGNLHRDAELWLKADLGGADRVHFVQYDTNVSEFYFGADAFFLSSREDPFPSVVLEAMSAGLPVVGFRGSSGTEELIAKHGWLVDSGDLAGLVNALDTATREDDEQSRTARARAVAEEFRFADYCFDLLRLLEPELEKVSVVVPNYNYARYLDERMSSIFEQTYPVFETLVLDDCSTDDSLVQLEDIAQASRRHFRVVANTENSGSPFVQWERGCQLANGKYVWVAEADDGSDPRFLEEVVLRLRHDGASFAFSDSVPINQEGAALAESYKDYYREAVGLLMDSSFAVDGKTFVERCLRERNLVLNASAVVWERGVLLAALASSRSALQEYHLAGDWHLYATAALEAPCVSYLSSPFNVHRRHETSVTGSISGYRHVDEVERVHRFIAESLGVNGTARQRMSAYAESLRDQFGIEASDTPKAARDSPTSALETLALEVAGDWVESSYYDDAENALDVFWGEGSPFLELFGRLDLTAVAELACGHGRHAEQIVHRTGLLVVMDIHESNVDFCRARLAEHENVQFLVNNGYDFKPLENSSLTAIFCYDAMVHFPGDVVESYMSDTARVLRPDGFALYHHSNYDAPDGRHYGLNPHARNRMTQEGFAQLAKTAGLEVVESRLLDWGEVPKLDCLTLLRKACVRDKRR